MPHRITNGAPGSTMKMMPSTMASVRLPVVSETFEVESLDKRGIRLPRGVEAVDTDSHIRPSPYEVLAKLRPAFGGVQTGGNSSAIVDGAGAVLVASSAYAKANGHSPMARIVASAAVGVPPQIMGIGPAPAIRAVLEAAGMQLGQIGRIEINEAFGAQILACVDELGLDPVNDFPAAEGFCNSFATTAEGVDTRLYGRCEAIAEYYVPWVAFNGFAAMKSITAA